MFFFIVSLCKHAHTFIHVEGSFLENHCLINVGLNPSIKCEES